MKTYFIKNVHADNRKSKNKKKKKIYVSMRQVTDSYIPAT